jgi:hypothetical protein
MFTVAVGHSIDPDAQEAVEEILAQCNVSLSGEIPQAGVLFAAIDYDHQAILDGILRQFPDLELVGCTTDGEISSEMGFQQDSLTLMLFCSDEVEIRAAVERNLSTAVAEKSQAVVREAQAKMTHPTRLCLAFPDGTRANVSAIVEGLQAALGPVPLLGGVAAEKPKAETTYQFYGDEVLQDALPILLLGGNLLLSHGFASGWRPLGQRYPVTEARGNIIYTIDHRPALALYQRYFEDYSSDAAYPLAVFPPGEERFFLRGSLSNDPVRGSLSMVGDVPVGAEVQVTEASRDDVVAAAKASLENAWSTYPGVAPLAALYFSCAWRRWVLGSETKREYEESHPSLAQILAQPGTTPFGRQTIPSCGFYTFGEIAPLRDQGPAVVHNTTFVTLLLGTR